MNTHALGEGAKPCETPAAAGLPVARTVVGPSDSGGNWRQIALVGFVLLAGCASTVEVPREVRVPVPVPCIAPEKLPERPQFMTDAEILAFDSYRRTWALWMDRALRQAYEAQLEAIAKGCSRIPPLKPVRQDEATNAKAEDKSHG